MGAKKGRVRLKCQSCGSDRIRILNPGKAVVKYKCLNCGHGGSFLITEGWNPRGPN